MRQQLQTQYFKVMKKFLLLVTMLAGASAFAQNPIIKNLYSADPTARIFNGKVYVYPSHDIPPATPDLIARKWFCMADYHVYSSENLTDWTDHGVILDQKDVPWGNPESYSMWAPDCIEKDGKYYFFFPANVQNGRGFGVGIAVADKPEGPFVAREKNIEGVSGIDPCVLQGYDGKWYIYWGGGGLMCAQLNDDFTGLHPDTPVREREFMGRKMTIVGVDVAANLPEGFKEGPFAFKHNGKYYLTYPWVRGKAGEPGWDGQPTDNHTETLAYSMSDNPYGPFEFKGLIMKESPTGCWTNHHSIVEYQGQWYLFYHHNDYSVDFDKNRSVRCDSLFFNEDGTIREVIPTLRGVGVTKATSPIQLDRYTSISGATIAFLDAEKPFDGWKTIFANKGDKVVYNTVDFGKGVKEITLRVKSSNPATLSIYADGTKLTTVNTKAIGMWAEETFKVNAKISGIHHLSAILDDGDVEVDWISFK